MSTGGTGSVGPSTSRYKGYQRKTDNIWSKQLQEESIGDVADCLNSLVNVDARKREGLLPRGSEQYLDGLVGRNRKRQWKAEGDEGHSKDKEGRKQMKKMPFSNPSKTVTFEDESKSASKSMEEESTATDNPSVSEEKAANSEEKLAVTSDALEANATIKPRELKVKGWKFMQRIKSKKDEAVEPPPQTANDATSEEPMDMEVDESKNCARPKLVVRKKSLDFAKRKPKRKRDKKCANPTADDAGPSVEGLPKRQVVTYDDLDIFSGSFIQETF